MVTLKESICLHKILQYNQNYLSFVNKTTFPLLPKYIVKESSIQI